jgi:predicted Zn-dependent protease
MSKKRKNKKGGPPMPAEMRRLAQAGHNVIAFQVSDDVKNTYKPGITDEIAEATSLAKKKRYAEAKVALQSIIEQEPQAKEAYTNLAAVCQWMGDEATAERIFHEAMVKFPDYPFPRINLAQICLKRGQVAEAQGLLTPLEKHHKFTSGEFRFYALTQSDVLATQGNYKAAQSWLKMLAQAMPGTPGLAERQLRYFIGRLLRRGK